MTAETAPVPSVTPAPNAETAPAQLPQALGSRTAAVFAHRGASGVYAEHSRAAYVQALNDGADGLEIDVHLTRDGEAVCFHDATVARTAGSTGAVADMTLQQMRALDITSWKTREIPEHAGSLSDQLMTLQDVLELALGAQRDVRLAIELKHPSPYGHRLEDRIMAILLSYGWNPETSRLHSASHTVEVSFMSFAPGALLHLSEIVPAEKLCALFSPVTSQEIRDRVSHVAFSAAVRPAIGMLMRRTLRDCESLIWSRRLGMAGPGMDYVRAHRAEVKAWLARGTRVRVWTVDSLTDVDLLLDIGVQEMTTNYPAEILRHIGR